MPLQKKMHWINTTFLLFALCKWLSSQLLVFSVFNVSCFSFQSSHTHAHSHSSPFKTVKVSKVSWKAVTLAAYLITVGEQALTQLENGTCQWRALFFLPPALKNHQCVHQTCSMRNQSDRHPHTSSLNPSFPIKYFVRVSLSPDFLY